MAGRLSVKGLLKASKAAREAQASASSSGAPKADRSRAIRLALKHATYAIHNAFGFGTDEHGKSVQSVQFARESQVFFVPDPDDDPLQMWWLLFAPDGPDDEYRGGEFIGTARVNDTYPYTPPVFSVLTPNGLYAPGQNPCISIGHYHSNNYSSGLFFSGFVQMVYGTYSDPQSLGDGIAINRAPRAECQQLARQSRAYNYANFPAVMAKFGEFYAAGAEFSGATNLLSLEARRWYNRRHGAKRPPDEEVELLGGQAPEPPATPRTKKTDDKYAAAEAE